MSYKGMTFFEYMNSADIYEQSKLIITAALSDAETIKADNPSLHARYRLIGGYILRDDHLWWRACQDAIFIMESMKEFMATRLYWQRRGNALVWYAHCDGIWVEVGQDDKDHWYWKLEFSGNRMTYHGHDSHLDAIDAADRWVTEWGAKS